MHLSGSGQPVSIKIQDSVEPPNQITMNYWIGCKASENMGCHDYNFDGLPQADEYEILTFSSPEILRGGLNIFEGVIDDSMLRHGKKVSFFVTGQDSKGNEIAMGEVQIAPHNPLELLVVLGGRGLHQIGMLTLSPISFEKNSNL